MQSRRIYYIDYAAGMITNHHNQATYLQRCSYIPRRVQIPQAHSFVDGLQDACYDQSSIGPTRLILPGCIIPGIWYGIPAFQWIAKSIKSNAKQPVNSQLLSAILVTVHPTSYRQPSYLTGDKLRGRVRGRSQRPARPSFHSTTSALNSFNPNHLNDSSSFTYPHQQLYQLIKLYLTAPSCYPMQMYVSIAYLWSDYIFPSFFPPCAYRVYPEICSDLYGVSCLSFSFFRTL